MTRPDLLQTVLRPHPDVVVRSIAGEPILIPVRRGAAEIDYLYTTNRVGGAVWSLLDGRRDGEEVARLVAQAFTADRDAARRDVRVFLEDLYDAGLVQAALGGVER